MGYDPIHCPECGFNFSVHDSITDYWRELYFSDDDNWMFEYMRSGRESKRNEELIKENEQLRGAFATLSKTKEGLREEYEFIDKIIKKYEDNPRANP